MTLVQAPALPVGLNQAEVAARVADGRVNVAPSPPGRTVAQIVRANVFTTFNALLGSLFVVALVVAPVQDSLFGLMVLWNTSIGTFQELRAKRTLDRLTVLSTPSARVRRAGAEVEVAPDEVVVDDIVVVGPGDQLVVDAEVVVADHLELDESLLTGEAEPQRRDAGDLLHSGSFVTAGAGWCRATAVGADAYAVRLADRARRPTTTHSELRAGIDRILRGIAVVLAPAAALLVWGQVRAGLGWREAAQRSVAGVVTMVPEGLVLLTSIAFAVGIVRLGRRRCLVKELAAVEGLARVSVVCLDKTGTLTAGSLRLAAVDVVEGTSPDLARRALVALVRADPAPNSTMQAIGAALAAEGGEWACTERVPFDSARKWSAARFDVGGDGDGGGAWVLGAPDVLLAPGDPLLDAVSARAEAGQRVLLVARAEKIAAAEGSSGGPPPLPVGLAPAALVGLEEELRPEVVETVGYFVRQGVELKVISGDNPRTVAA
ncbi:MAG: HAD-IC family P-type ATPase, partial [Acidimicrobiia bacterium]|nr:HAD-IC family P-type ATPase [Acidimicrobiia bacterium]